jgi:hypothetical protein
MKRRVITSLIILVLGLTAGCSYLPKKDTEPPPLPPMEEPKRAPLEMKGEYFDTFPWTELDKDKPRKDGTDPDSTVYTFKANDTLESVAEKEMGARGQAGKLAQYNDLTSPTSVPEGDKIVIPYPFVGVRSEIQIKPKKGAKDKKEKPFGDPQPFGSELKSGDHYRMVFTSNVDGHLYVFRESIKTGVTMLYPPKPKTGRRNKNDEPPRDPGKVTAFDPVRIPIGDKGFLFDPKNAGDRVTVFLSLRNIAELDLLKDKKEITTDDIKGVMREVSEQDIKTYGAVRMMRFPKANTKLGFTVNIQ